MDILVIHTLTRPQLIQQEPGVDNIMAWHDRMGSSNNSNNMIFFVPYGILTSLRTTLDHVITVTIIMHHNHHHLSL